MSIRVLPVAPCRLGESPLWHPVDEALYWVDIPARRVHRYRPDSDVHSQWQFDQDLGCCVAVEDGRLLLAQRDGVWLFDPQTESRQQVCAAPYDPSVERFNDGKVDPLGRLWVGTVYEPRDRPGAALYCLEDRELTRVATGVTVSNGLAWSPDGTSMYWADTKAHLIRRGSFVDGDLQADSLHTFAQFPVSCPNAAALYQGRPDGAAVDVEGCYWVAMYEGGRLLRLSPEGDLLDTVPLPLRCPTMPCFGGADLQTLYVTSARDQRSVEELEAMPWSGQVLTFRVPVPGLPSTLAKLPVA